jgi:hypothetical protein
VAWAPRHRRSGGSRGSEGDARLRRRQIAAGRQIPPGAGASETDPRPGRPRGAQAIERKRCPRCCPPGETLPASAFGRNASRGDRLRPYCRACEATERRDRREQQKVAKKPEVARPALLPAEWLLPADLRYRWARGQGICEACRGPWHTPPGEMETYCRTRTDAGLWVCCERPDERDMLRLRLKEKP